MAAALVQDGVLLPHPPASPRQVLTSTPQGVYTTTTVHPAHGVADWTLHQQRITRNALSIQGGDARLVDLLTACNAAWHGTTPCSLVLLVQLYADDEVGGGTYTPTRTPPPTPPTQGTPHLQVHTSPAPAPPSPGAAVVVGPPRPSASIKDCAWATARQPFEAQLPPGACEGLLCNAEGGLTEGLVTNLFVVDANGTVHTAPEGVVLGGIVRTRVMQTLAALEVPTVEATPLWSHRHTWVGAFVTNGVRLVQPLTAITLPRGDWAPAAAPGTVELGGAAEPVTEAVARTILQEHTPLAELV